jgi:hypothetical protein
LLLLLGRQLRGRLWQATAVALIAADLLAFGWPLAPGTDPSIYQTPVRTAKFLESQPSGRVFVAYPYARAVYDTYVSLQAYGPADLDHLQGLRESQIPNLNTVHGLAGVGNYDPLTIGLYRDLWAQLEGERNSAPSLGGVLPILNLFSIRYVISDTIPSQTLLTPVYETGPSILLNDAALPEAYVVPQARVVKDRETRLEILADPAFDLRVEVLLSQTPAMPLPATSSQTAPITPPSIRVARERSDRVSVRVDMDQPGYLVLADTYYPGWRAEVDGEETELLAANHAFRAVGLEPGRHVVVFEYAPVSFKVGAWITLGASLAVVTCLAAAYLSGRRM